MAVDKKMAIPEMLEGEESIRGVLDSRGAYLGGKVRGGGSVSVSAGLDTALTGTGVQGGGVAFQWGGASEQQLRSCAPREGREEGCPYQLFWV